MLCIGNILRMQCILYRYILHVPLHSYHIMDSDYYVVLPISVGDWDRSDYDYYNYDYSGGSPYNPGQQCKLQKL